MRGCLLLIIGIVIGAVAAVAAQALITPPPAVPPPSPTDSDMVILFRNELFSRALQAEIGQSAAASALQGLSVQAQEGQTVVVAGTGVVGGTGIKLPFRVTLRPSVVQNRVRLQIAQAQVGMLKLPGSIFSSIQDTINQEIDQALAGQQYQITGVGTTSDGVVVDVKLNH